VGVTPSRTSRIQHAKLLPNANSRVMIVLHEYISTMLKSHRYNITNYVASFNSGVTNSLSSAIITDSVRFTPSQPVVIN